MRRIGERISDPASRSTGARNAEEIVEPRHVAREPRELRRNDRHTSCDARLLTGRKILPGTRAAQ